MSNLKAAVSEKEAAVIRKRLNVWAKSSNPTCADCCRTNPTWASVNLGVLVCLECAGRHRSLGTHITKMRSITLDTVLPEEAHFLLQMTNDLANRYWEARLPSSERSQALSQANFIQQKYSDRRWALQDPAIPAPARDCVPQAHPWWSAQDTSSAAAPALASVHLAPPGKFRPAKSHCAAAQKQTKPAVVATDLIDFGKAPEVPAADLTADSKEPDPFSTSHAPAAMPLSADAPCVHDPFASASEAASTPPTAPPPTAAKPQQPPVDPFSSMSLGQASQGEASSINHAVSAPALPVHTSTLQPGAQGSSSGHHSRTGSVSSVMSAPTEPSRFSAPAANSAAPPASHSPRQPARKPQSKAEMNAHILSLYDRPSSSPGGMPSMAPSHHRHQSTGHPAGVGVSWTNPAHTFAARQPPPAAAALPASQRAMPGYGSPAQPR